MMKNLNTDLMTVQQNGEFESDEAVCLKKINSVYDEPQINQFMDMLNTVVMNEKSNAVIAKKEVDTSAYISKVYVDSEQGYINYLMGENRRKDITSEEREKTIYILKKLCCDCKKSQRKAEGRRKKVLIEKYFCGECSYCGLPWV